MKTSEQQELNQPQKQLRRRCKMPALILWQAVAEDRPEGTPAEKQDPQRRQDPHKNYPPADLMPVDARLRVGTVPMRVPSMPE